MTRAAIPAVRENVGINQHPWHELTGHEVAPTACVRDRGDRR